MPEAISFFEYQGIEVQGIFTTDKSEKTIGSVPVLKRAKLGKTLRYPLVFVGAPRKGQFSSTRNFEQRLLWMNPEQVIKQRSRLADKALMQIEGSRLLQLWKTLEDSASRKTLVSIIASRLRDNNNYLRIAKYSEYSHPLVKVRQGDVVYDGGAHVGNVGSRFAKAAGPEGAVYCFEPLDVNFEALLTRAEKYPQMFAIKKGLWSDDAVLKFEGTDKQSASCAISEDGNVQIEATSIDAFSHVSGVRPPTLIKLDVEGAEAKVLEGAREVIGRYKPRLMISAYHERHHLWALIEQIKSIRKDYKFYLGHHNFYHTETDVYAL